MPSVPSAVRVVHEGRGGYVEIGRVRYPIEHVGEGRFAIHVPSGHHDARLAADRALLEQLCAAEPGRWYLDERQRRT